MELNHPRAIQRATVHEASPVRRLAVYSVLALLYFLSLRFCYNTMGEPLELAKAQARKIDEAEWDAALNNTSEFGDDDDNDIAEVLLDVQFDATALEDEEAEFEVSSSGDAVDNEFEFDSDGDVLASSEDRDAADDDDDGEEDKDGLVGATASPSAVASPSAAPSSSTSSRPLPSPFLPNAFAVASLLGTVSLHALFFLMCRWMVWFKALTLYQPGSVKRGSVVLMIPHSHRGTGALCDIDESKTTGRLSFVFQRQRYELLSPDETAAHEAARVAKAGGAEAAAAAAAAAASSGVDGSDDGALVGAAAPNSGSIRLVASPVNLPVAEYVSSRGLGSAAVDTQKAAFGLNRLTIPTPQFFALFKEQLLSPIAIFQVFCAALWLLDEYWQYTGFTLFSLFALESTTTYQRLRTQKTLFNMCPKPFTIPVYRSGAWMELSSDQLLPGDLISLHWHPSRRGGPTSAAAAAKRTRKVVSAGAGAGAGAGAAPTPTPAEAAAKQDRSKNSDVVPCDCLLLRGSAVVNEATLTGESVPQMKDSLRVDASTPDASRELDLDGLDRVHVLFSGTTLITSLADQQQHQQHQQSASRRPGSPLPDTPDGGALCYVLRTGFNSSQGSLVQLIEYSTQKVSADSKETWMALLILFSLALIAAGYVLKKGLEKGNRTTHELLLKCVIILTSVVPQHLPMQMAMAVNTALLALNRASIFCTEPFRVPFAGKVTHCLFDKTGTITTDQLVPVGVVCASASASDGVPATSTSSVSAEHATAGTAVRVDGLQARPDLNGKTGVVSVPFDPTSGRVTVEFDHDPAVKGRFKVPNVEVLTANARRPVPVNRASTEAALVLGACNALVSVEGAGLVGDPIELAALRGVRWAYDAATQTASPGDWKSAQRAADSLKADVDKLAVGSAARVAAEKRLEALHDVVRDARKQAADAPISGVRIQHRHHFSSKLQRMSVVAHVKASSSAVAFPAGPYCLVKGSPEAISKLLAPGARPVWFDATYQRLAERGMRVLALAYKHVPTLVDDMRAQFGLGPTELPPREWVESGLQFAGFVAFECRVRADSPMVLQALLQSNHTVAMATGDAALTAIHVAKTVGICRPGIPTLVLTLTSGGGGGGVEWVDTSSGGGGGGGGGGSTTPFDASSIRALAVDNNLATTETALEAASIASDGKVWESVDCISVLARMSPAGKARVIRAMQKFRAAHVLMCGDGGNDVGALKQADVGLALLSGYGNTNTSSPSSSSSGGEDGDGDGAAGATPAAANAEDALNQQSKVLKLRQQAAAQRIKAVMAAKRKELLDKTKGEWLQEELEARSKRGESLGITGNFAAMKAVMGRMNVELRKESVRLQKLHGNVYDATSGGGAKDAAEQMAEASESEVPMVRPGDASIAAPFTSRSPSIKAVVDLLRQGRCTLLSALQQQQIMMLECCIAAFTLSALSLEGARSSERQMMASSWLIMSASLSFSYSSPIDKMHPVRPLKSLFHPAVALSTLGQAAIHLMCLAYAVQMATEAMGPEALQAVVDFNRRIRDGEAEQLRLEAAEADEDPLASFYAIWSTPFKPNLMNTTVWLVETAQIMAVLFVNYKGRPWMKGLLENTVLSLSIFTTVAGVAGAAWEIAPQLNSVLHLHPFPSDEFRFKVMGLVVASVLGTFLWDRLMTAIFAPKIFGAMWGEAKKTTMADLSPIMWTLVKVVGVFLLVATGNILVWAAAGFWFYRRRKANQEAAMASVV